MLTTLVDGLRALVLAPPRSDPARARTGTFFGITACSLAAAIAVSAASAPPPWQLQPEGVAALLALALLLLAGGAGLAAAAQRREAVWGLAALLVAAALWTELLLRWPAQLAGQYLATEAHPAAPHLLRAAVDAWWFLMLAVLARRLVRRPGPAFLAALLAWLLTAPAWAWLPTMPALARVDVDAMAGLPVGAMPAGAPGHAAADEPPAFDPEAVFFYQRPLLDAALVGLAPQRPGQVDLYAITFAGDGAETVFANEADYAARLLAGRFGADARVMILANDAASVATRPLATWTNLHYALEGIAGLIDPAEDLVLVYIATHGSEDHELLVDLDPLPLDQIAPVDLAEALATTPALGGKVVIVNACYSGGFIDALDDGRTLIITSARADRSSFGCGVESDITWFGEAFLVEGLNRSRSLRGAFAIAEGLVAEWEQAEGMEASQPQLRAPAAIDSQLERWSEGLGDAPPVPFSPPARDRQSEAVRASAAPAPPASG